MPAAQRSGVDLALRIVAAASVLVIGAVHLKLYFDGYRDVPNANVGRSILLNAVASLVVAVGLVVWRHWLVLLAGLVLVDATLVAFALSRTDRGIFGFSESGFNPSPEAALAVTAEIAAAALLLGLLVLEWSPSQRATVVARRG
jgi:hypothetical protein